MICNNSSVLLCPKICTKTRFFSMILDTNTIISINILIEKIFGFFGKVPGTSVSDMFRKSLYKLLFP